MPFCTKCGADTTGMKFCSKCGAPAEAQPTPEGASAGAEAGSSQASAEAPEGNEAGSAQASGQASAGAGPAGAPSGAASSSGASGAAVPESSQHIAAALSYITPVAVLLLLIEPYKDLRFVRFHAFQSLFYFVAAIVLQMIGSILGPLSLLITLAVVFVWFFVLVKAYQGEMFEIPIIGPLAAKQV